MNLSFQHQAIAEFRFSPIAAIVGLGLIGHSFAGSLGAGIALMIPLLLTLISVLLEDTI
jgi:hypothetical protein